ncbi:hypothetical protein HGA34_05140 [Candidatus Falkowbacteria bacterium]|nr:hypothetical protein [Candidatus Falkowbacteria bacterium]
MTKQIVRDGFGWGFLLWLVGYVIGIALFPFVPGWAIGWIIMPIGIVLTLGVLFRKIDSAEFSHYLSLAAIWTAIAVVFDYFFLVLIFKPADGYYKLDVYAYYVLMFVLPIAVGLRKIEAKNR